MNLEKMIVRIYELVENECLKEIEMIKILELMNLSDAGLATKAYDVAMICKFARFEFDREQIW